MGEFRVGTAAVFIGCLFALASRAGSPEPPKGFVVYSILNEDDRIDREALEVRRADSQRLFRLTTGGGFVRKYDFEARTGPGIVAVWDLPPGAYEVTGIVAHTLLTEEARPRLSVRFTIEGGKATYLGRFTPHIELRKGLAGVPFPRAITYSVSNESKQDLPLAAAKLPAGMPVQSAAPSGADETAMADGPIPPLPGVAATPIWR